MRFHVTLILISFLSPHQVQNSVYDHADGALHNHAMILQYSYITTSFWCLLNRKKQLFYSSCFILFILSSKLFLFGSLFCTFWSLCPRKVQFKFSCVLKTLDHFGSHWHHWLWLWLDGSSSIFGFQVNNTFTNSLWLCGVPQGFVMGPILLPLQHIICRGTVWEVLSRLFHFPNMAKLSFLCCQKSES